MRSLQEIDNIKGTFNAKIGTKKNRNCKDLTEEEVRRGGKNTQNCPRKG